MIEVWEREQMEVPREVEGDNVDSKWRRVKHRYSGVVGVLLEVGFLNFTFMQTPTW